MNNYALFDIGGNAVKYKINNKKIETFSTINKNKKYVLSCIAKIVNENNVKYVGISSPCGVDATTGQLYGISGIKDYSNFNLYKELKLLIKSDIHIIAHNDANAALLGNLVGKNYLSAAQITIGTGIGGGIYLNNKIITNKLAMAGEFGYIPFNEKFNTSELCSANALVNQINRKKNTNYKNFEEVLESNKNYSSEIRIWADRVAKLISQVFFSIAPEVLFISGGIINNQNIKDKIVASFKNIMINFKYDFEFHIIFKNTKNSALLGMEKALKDKYKY